MDSPPPDFFSWAFWFKDSASVRDLLISLVAVTGIPFLIWRDFSTHRTAKAALDQSKAAAEQVKIATRQSEIAAGRHEQQTKADRDRRITDSFAKAVELLGSGKLEARLGAIYALERIARESKEDHWPIMETLTAYVLTRLPIQQMQSGSNSDENKSPSELEEKRTKKTIDLPVDLRAVLTVLGRRNLEHDPNGQRIDLRNADMSRLNLSSFNLSGFNLNRTNMTEANLDWAKLLNATLFNANLAGTDLAFSDLSGADLHRVNLNGTKFIGASLIGAKLAYTDLRKTDLVHTDLTRADLTGAKLDTDQNFDSVILCNTIMPDGTVNNRDCPPESDPPNPSETPSAPN